MVINTLLKVSEQIVLLLLEIPVEIANPGLNFLARFFL